MEANVGAEEERVTYPRWAYNVAVQVLGRCGSHGQRLLHRWGFEQFITKTYNHIHLRNCPWPDVTYEPRPQGHIKRCRSCGAPVEIHFACWTVRGGMMPEEVVVWMVKALRPLVEAEQ